MRRRLFAVASAVSLLLCLATVGLWVLAGRRFPRVWYRTGPSRRVEISCQRDGIHLLQDAVNSTRLGISLDPPPSGDPWDALFAFEADRRLPYLGLICPAAVLPAFYAATLFYRRRAWAGHCRSCGYSLTGNTSGVCPECGTAFEANAKVNA